MGLDPNRSEQPHDRLTRMCDTAIQAYEKHPEYIEGDKAIIFLNSDTEKRAGLVLHGYDDDLDAVVDLIMHLKAIMEANGKTLIVAPLGNDNPEAN